MELIAIRVDDISFSMEEDGTVTLQTKGGGMHERCLAPEVRAVLDTRCKAADIKVWRNLPAHR